MEKEISAGAVMFIPEKGIRKYLLLHKAKTDKYKESWMFPKGHVEIGEEYEETAVREIKEETGLNVRFKKGFKQWIQFFYKRNETTIHKEVVYFLADAASKDVQLSEEHMGFAWLPFEKALEKLTFESDKNVLDKAEFFLKKEAGQAKLF